MYATYLHLDITVHDGWRAIVRAAARKLTSWARRDPAHREARHRFYRQMLAHHLEAQRLYHSVNGVSIHAPARGATSVGDRDVTFPLPHGRGDEFHHGSPGPDPHSLPAKGLDARDVRISGLHIEHDQA